MSPGGNEGRVPPDYPMRRIYLLSPAHCGGKRARLLLEGRGEFDLARRLRAREASLGEVFSFLSGLYFRGKLAYARAFASPPAGMPGALVITPREGLRPPDEAVTISRLRRFGAVPVDTGDPRYARPLRRDARSLAARTGPECVFILLGSIATGKYIDLFSLVFGDRLRLPAEFIGRGDMSRGGLLLRRVDEGRPLEYIRLEDAPRHGPRPPRLEPRRRPEAPAAASGTGRSSSAGVPTSRPASARLPR